MWLYKFTINYYFKWVIFIILLLCISLYAHSNDTIYSRSCVKKFLRNVFSLVGYGKFKIQMDNNFVEIDFVCCPLPTLLLWLKQRSHHEQSVVLRFY